MFLKERKAENGKWCEKGSETDSTANNDGQDFVSFGWDIVCEDLWGEMGGSWCQCGSLGLFRPFICLFIRHLVKASVMCSTLFNVLG